MHAVRCSKLLSGAPDPPQVMFTRYLLAEGRPDEMALLMLAPLNLPASLLTDLPHVRWLSLVGFAACVAEYSAVQHSRVVGSRLL